MTKINKTAIEEVRPVLDRTINGINAISVLRERIELDLVNSIDKSKVVSILDKKDNLEDILTEDEILTFFRVIFNQLKDDNFNPDNFRVKEKRAKAVRKNKDSEHRAIDNPRVYNPKFKDQFLKEHKTEKGTPYSPETKRVAIILFAKVGEREAEFDKDVYSFDGNEFEWMLTNIKATTLRSLQNSISTIEQYIDFAIEKGKWPSEKGNIATRYSSANILTKFLDKKAEENMIFSKQEIDNLSSYSENAQDGVILSLLFDGVSHKRKFIELRNIQIQHCDLENLVINIPELVDEDNGEILPERQVPISANTAMMIRAAMKDEHYVSITGSRSRRYKLAESDYVLRGLRNNYQIKWENISQRIIRIAELEGYPYLNATNVSYSGQVYYAKELMDQGVSVDDACDMIIKRFNINDNDSAHFYLKNRIEKANRVITS